MWCLAGRLRDTLSIVGRVLLLALLVGLSSCVKPTVFPRYLTVADVINNVKCELYLAIRETPDTGWLDDWTAKFSIVLQVKRQTTADGEFTFVVPYNAPVGLFTIVVGGKAEKSGQSRAAFDFSSGKLKTFRSTDQCAYWQQLNSRNNLAGETGLRLWFGNVIEGFNQARIKSTSLTYTLQFVTTLNGHIKPSFKSAYPSKKVFSGAFGITRDRTDDNQLTIAFTPPPQVFDKTKLGEALARLEALLRKKETEKTIVKRGVNEAQATIKRLAPVVKLGEQSKAKGLMSKAAEPEFEKNKANFATAKGNEKEGMKQLEEINQDMEVLQAAKEATQASAAAVAQTAPASTERRLNELLLLDAIRDIPR